MSQENYGKNNQISVPNVTINDENSDRNERDNLTTDNSNYYNRPIRSQLMDNGFLLNRHQLWPTTGSIPQHPDRKITFAPTDNVRSPDNDPFKYRQPYQSSTVGPIHRASSNNSFCWDDDQDGGKRVQQQSNGQIPRINLILRNRTNGRRVDGDLDGINGESYLLWIVTPVAASFAVAIVIAALAGPQWLTTEEKLPNTNYNGTVNLAVLDDGVYVTKYTKSSLWLLCVTQGLNYYCTTIDYFPKEEYSPDPNDSTMAIPYAVTRATPFFLISGIFLIFSYIILMGAMCSQQNSVYFFTSGILFIISGLLMLIGLIMYISIFKAEVGSKLRPKSTLQPPMFTFKYGQSFFLYVIGFISTEFVGVLNVFLFINLQQIGLETTVPCLSHHPKKITYFNSGQTKSRPMDDFAGNASQLTGCKKHNQHRKLHLMNSSPPMMERTYFLSPFNHKRYPFDLPPPICNVHRRDITNSLNDLYTKPLPNRTYTSNDGYTQKISRQTSTNVPLTRSVSTTTDIFNPDQPHRTSETSPKSNNNSRDNLNTDMTCGITKGILLKNRKTKDQLFAEFCERAGNRPRPKDIYYIESDDMLNDHRSTEENIFIVDNYSSARYRNRLPNHLKSINTNSQSLKDLNVDKPYPNGLLDNNSQFLNRHLDRYFRHDHSDSNIYQSNTLPRNFLKQNHSISNQLGNFRYPNDSDNRSYENIDRTDYNYGRYEDYYKKSYDTIASRNIQPDTNRDNLKTPVVHWPNAIPASPSNYPNRPPVKSVQYQGPPPPPPSTQSNRSFYDQKIDNFSSDDGQGKLNIGNPDGRSDNEDSQEDGTFDLDKIEQERRKSHASLFGIDRFNEIGTPV